MERKLNPDIHMICGKCGCATMFEFKMSKDGSERENKIYPAIFITCKNCNTLTDLSETAEDKTDWNKLGLVINQQ